MLLTSTPIGIHKLQLMVRIDKDHFRELAETECPRNKGKVHEENIGRRRVTYTFYPSGTVEIAVATSDLPFKIETEEDESIIFSFLGQVKDRLVYLLKDIRERAVPQIMEWHLKACDVNKDIEIDPMKGQLFFPDIQLRYVDRVFRLYIKNIQEKSFYRVEESMIPRIPFLEALANIRHPYQSLEDKIDKLMESFKNMRDTN